MADVVIYHNPNCSNSRRALAWLEEQGIDHDVVAYLKSPPNRAALEGIVKNLDDPPADLVRHDRRFSELGLAPDSYTTKKAVVDLLVEHPELMQRPVVVRGRAAIIARPPEDRLETFFA
jgi:arsenate reductase (glutaredoxin)